MTRNRIVEVVDNSLPVPERVQRGELAQERSLALFYYQAIYQAIPGIQRIIDTFGIGNPWLLSIVFLIATFSLR